MSVRSVASMLTLVASNVTTGKFLSPIGAAGWEGVGRKDNSCVVRPMRRQSDSPIRRYSPPVQQQVVERPGVLDIRRYRSLDQLELTGHEELSAFLVTGGALEGVTAARICSVCRRPAPDSWSAGRVLRAAVLGM